MGNEPLLMLADIHPKMELRGTVKRVELVGAVLDVGTEVDALLHISQIQTGRVKNTGDILEEGKDVVVWVKNVDADRGTLSVTMIRPPAVDWREIQVGQTFQGNVVRIEKFGVFIDIGAERPGLVHVSEMSSEYVSSPSDVVKEGEEVEVRVLGVNRKKNQIDLSMKPLVSVSTTIELEDEGEEEEDAPTAMALAYQRAVGSASISSKSSAKAQKRKKDLAKQDDILNRTLQRLEKS